MDASDLARQWSDDLGLALAPLFGSTESSPFQAIRPDHYALLDGVTASFTLSAAAQPLPDPTAAVNWAWSANLRKHVWVDVSSGNVHVMSVARPMELPEIYKVDQVGANLERFLEYLTSDRQLPRSTVVQYLIGTLDKFREAARSLTYPEEADMLALQALLLDIASRQEGNSTMDLSDLAERFALQGIDGIQVRRLLDRAEAYRLNMASSDFNYECLTGIAVRHAGGALFQRATSELTQRPQMDLFTSSQGSTIGKPTSLAYGGYFTPPGLARSLCEAAIQGKLNEPVLRICDPACGSGVFLAEILRALGRAEYPGQVHLVGQDILPLAVQTARFVARSAALDFGADRVTIQIEQRDSLASPPEGSYHIVLMNPPFKAWEQAGDQKDQIRAILGTAFTGKPDLSLAFAELAHQMLFAGGVLATLMPIGVLTTDSSKRWRDQTSQTSSVRFIGALGDHYIFEHALVNVGMLVIEKVVPSPSEVTAMLWANEEPRASSHALRRLRKLSYDVANSENSRNLWRLYVLSHRELSQRSHWLPADSGAEDTITALRHRQFPLLGSLFKVQQGIRTGCRDAFILTKAQVAALPVAEQLAFRPIAEKDAITGFRVNHTSMLFYCDVLKEKIANEANFQERFPVYFNDYIRPNRDALNKRPRNRKIWQLSEPRAWMRKEEPRIVTRFFLGKRQYGVAVDAVGRYAVVQGYGWEPQWNAIFGERPSPDQKRIVLEVYALILASEHFFEMVKTVSVNIAGGQYDLAPKYIDTLPLPDWQSIHSILGAAVESIDSVNLLMEQAVKNPFEHEKLVSRILGLL